MVHRFPSLTEIMLVATLCFFNTLDCLMTKQLVGADGEWNPLMAALLRLSPSLFVFVKIFVVNTSSIVLLYFESRSTLANKAIFILTIAYTAVMICHLFWMSTYLG